MQYGLCHTRTNRMWVFRITNPNKTCHTLSELLLLSFLEILIVQHFRNRFLKLKMSRGLEVGERQAEGQAVGAVGWPVIRLGQVQAHWG